LADASDIVISEIQVGGTDSKDEFIELYNNDNDSVDLTGFKLERKSKSGTKYLLVSSAKFSKTIPPKGYFLITHSDYEVKYSADLVYSSSGYSIAPDNTVVLSDKSGSILDKVGYGLATDFENSSAVGPGDNKSIERKLSGNIMIDTDDNSKDFSISYAPSPGEDPKIKPDPKVYPDDVILSEAVPNPDGNDEEGEFIEIYNGSGKKENLKDWKLSDKSGKEYAFPSVEIKPGEFLAIYYKDSKITLNNSDEEIKLYDPNEKLVSSVSYGDTKEGYSYSFDGAKWKWTSSITPNAENQFDEPIETKIKKDKTVYRNTYAEFEVNTNKKSAKVVWDFGDGHKSYKAKTKHKYAKNGKYKVTAKISGGSEDKIEEFTIKVEKFPEKAVKIIGLAPNPKGKDTTTENIIVWNKSKKKVNLKDWSVATGWKNLYNHPIAKDFILKPGEKKTLGRNVSGFALNNKKAKVELRYPDGKIASKTKYDKKTETVKEGEVYEKTGTQWAWKKTVLPNTTRLAKAELKPVEQKNNIQLASAIMQIKDSDLIIPQEYIGKQSIDNILPKQNIVVASYRLNNSTVAEKIAEGIFSGMAYSNSTNNINLTEIKNNDESFIKKYLGGINFWMNKIMLNFI
jgi:hypothetical protein